MQQDFPAAECIELPEGLVIPHQKTLLPYFLIVDPTRDANPSPQFVALYGQQRACDFARMIGQGRTREAAWFSVTPRS